MAAVDYFLKIDGVDGESIVSRAREMDRAPVVELGRDQRRDGDPREAAPARSRSRTSTSPPPSEQGIAFAVASPAPPASTSRRRRWTCRKAGAKHQEVYLVITLEDVLVSSYRLLRG